MQGLMQTWPLTVDRILDYAKTWHGDREVVSRSLEGPIVRTTYKQIIVSGNATCALLAKLMGAPISAEISAAMSARRSL